MRLPQLPPGMTINRDWSEEDNIIFRDFILAEMAGQENSAPIPFAKFKTKIPGMIALRCRTQWKNVTCWQIDHKWQIRHEPFSAEDRKTLVEGVRDQGVETEEEISWKRLSKEFPNSNRKELKYYWTNLVKLNRLQNVNLKDLLIQLISKVDTTQKQRVPAIGKTNKTKFDKLQMRKEVLQRTVDNIKAKISALQTRLEKTESDLAVVTENLDQMKEYGIDEIPSVSEAVAQGVDTAKSKPGQPKTITEVQASQNNVTKPETPRKAKKATKSVAAEAVDGEVPDARKTKKAKAKSVTVEAQNGEAPEVQKAKKAKAVKSVTNENHVSETPDARKSKKAKAKSVTAEDQNGEAPDTPKVKRAKAAKLVTIENQDGETPDVQKSKKAKTQQVTVESSGSPKPKDVTETKSDTETRVDSVSESFMDTSINHMSRFFDDDDEL